MSNIQVTHDTDLNNARSESSIAINPNNPMQIVAASKKFRNLQTYDFTLATEYSNDGGKSWHDSPDLILQAVDIDGNIHEFTLLSDPALAWDDSGNVFLVGLAGNNPPNVDIVGIVVYKSTDGGQTWNEPLLIHQSKFDDKQWAAGDSNPASPFQGHVYAVWDDGDCYGRSSLMRFARTKDQGNNWIGTGSNLAPSNIVVNGIPIDDSHSPEINVAADGTVYIVWISGSDIKMIVSTDGGISFQWASKTTNVVATNVVTLNSSPSKIHGWSVLPPGNFRVQTFPTACVFGQTVVVAWADFRDGVSRIYYALSTDGGNSWIITGPSGKPLFTGTPDYLQHFHPQLVADQNGVIGCAFYEFNTSTKLVDVIMAQSFDNGASFDHFTVTDQPWDPSKNPPWSHYPTNPFNFCDPWSIDSSLTFIGDYFGLDASTKGFYPLWTDTRTGMQELWTNIVPEKKCHTCQTALIRTQDGGVDSNDFSEVIVLGIKIPPQSDASKFVVLGRLQIKNNDGDPQNATARLTTSDGNTELDRIDVRLAGTSNDEKCHISVSLQGIFSIPCSDPPTDMTIDIRFQTFNGTASQASLIVLVVDDLLKTSDGENFSPWCNR